MEWLKNWIFSILRRSEKYTKTDMVYLAKGSFWLNLNNIISTLLAFILSILFANYVTKETYGNYQFIVSIASIIGTLSLTGMNAAVTQAVARKLEGVLKDSVKTQIRFSFIPFLIGLCISAYYLIQTNNVISISVLIISILMPFSNSLNTWGAFVSGKKRFDSFFWQSQIINSLYYVAMIFIIFLAPSAIFLVIANFGAMFIGNLIAYFYTINKFKPNNNSENAALDYGKKLSLSSILPLVALQIDNILVFHLLGAQNLAIYAFASNIPDKFMSLVRPLSTLALPKMAERAEGWEKSSFVPKVLRFFVLSVFMSLIFIIFAPLIYHTLFPAYQESIRYAQIYIFATAFSATASFCISAIFASRSNNIFKFNIFNPIINILAITLGAYTLGIWGAILGKIIGSGFSFLYSFVLEKEN